MPVMNIRHQVGSYTQEKYTPRLLTSYLTQLPLLASQPVQTNVFGRTYPIGEVEPSKSLVRIKDRIDDDFLRETV